MSVRHPHKDCGSLEVSTTDNRACYTKLQSVGSSAGYVRYCFTRSFP
jgi:hypothetical protein